MLVQTRPCSFFVFFSLKLKNRRQALVRNRLGGLPKMSQLFRRPAARKYLIFCVEKYVAK